MSDPKKAVNDLTAKAAFDAAKKAAENAIQDALSTDEERAERKAEQAALAKRKRNKLIAYGIVGVLLTLGVIGLVVSYWQWFFLLGLVGLAGLYARYRWRKRRAAPAEEKVKVLPSREPVRVKPPEPVMKEPAKVDIDREIEDELAALKARVDK